MKAFRKAQIMLLLIGVSVAPIFPTQAHGAGIKASTPITYRQMELLLSQQDAGRPYVTAPEVPADRLKVLREAFVATMNDPDFIEAARTGNVSLDPLNAAQVDALIRNAYASPPEIVERAKSLLEQAMAR